MDMTADKRPLKVFLCHAHADRDPVPQGDDMRGLPAGTRLTPRRCGLSVIIEVSFRSNYSAIDTGVFTKK